MKEKEQKPILPSLKRLKVGGSTSFPIQRMGSVKTSCNLMNNQTPGKYFATSVVREKGVIKVTRTK